MTRIVGGAWATIDRAAPRRPPCSAPGRWRRAREVTLPAARAGALGCRPRSTFLFCFTSFGVILILGGPGRATRRDRDLQPGGAALRPPGRRGAVAAPARRRRDRARRRERARGARRARRDARRRERRAPAPGRPASGSRSPSCSALGSARPRAPARRPRAPLARQLGRALRGDARAPRRAVAGSRATRSPSRAWPRCDRARRRRPRRGRARAAAARRRRRARPAPARRLGRDARLRVHHRVRRAAGRLPLVVVARARRAVARGRAVRRAHRHARAARRSTRGCARPRRRSAPRPAAPGGRSTCRSSSRAFGVAAGFAFAIALGEFGATVFVARAEQPTLPVAIFRFLGRPGETSQGTAAALAVVLAAITVCAALAAERLAGRRGRGL